MGGRGSRVKLDTDEGLERMAMASVQNCLDAIDGCLRADNVVNKEVLGG